MQFQIKNPLMLNIIEYYKDRQWPIRAQLELTKKCNFKCLHCYQMDRRNAIKDNFTLDSSVWENLLYRLRENQVFFVRLTGGEPTLHPQFFTIYKVAATIGLKVEVQTNGSILTAQMIDIFRQYVPRLVRISLYGFSENTYDNFCRNRNAFSNILKNIDKLREIDVPIHIVVIITDNNVQEVEDIIVYCNSYNIPLSLHFSICNRLDGSISKVTGFNPFDSLNKLDHWPLIKKKIESQTQSYKNYKIWKNDVKVCWAGLLSFCVDERLNMHLCPIYRYDSVSLEKVSFEEAWWQMRILRKKVIEKLNPCSKCINRNICGKCTPTFANNTTVEANSYLNKTNCINMNYIEEK
jgi:MoaA/NifB/PqqE/SkfB family radical SAM enzyme